jgi:hypothetical protein
VCFIVAECAVGRGCVASYAPVAQELAPQTAERRFESTCELVVIVVVSLRKRATRPGSLASSPFVAPPSGDSEHGDSSASLRAGESA